MKNIPKIPVDFNEMLEPNLVLLAAEDTKLTSTGESISIYTGLKVLVYMEDIDVHGQPDNLIAFGVAEKNTTTGWGRHAKWCCRIDDSGIRHESEV